MTIDRKIAPSIKDAIDFKLELKPYNLFTLGNHVPVYIVDAGTQDVLQLEIVFYAGNAFEQQKGVASVTNFLLRNGTNTRTAFEINQAFEYYGAHCNRACHNETATVNVSTLSKHIDKLLPIVKDMITNSVFLQEELNVYQQNSKQKLSVSLKKSDFVASRLIDAYIYGDHHPYGNYMNTEDFDALTIENAKAFYKQYYLNGQCKIFVSGKLPSNLQEMLQENFGALPLNKHTHTPPTIPTTPAKQKKYRIQNDAEGLQGAIRIARDFPNRHHPDFMKVMVLNTLFGGYFGSRLMSNIREDKGYTYGIHSYVQNHMQQTAWLISTDAGKDVCEATIQEVYKEMKLLREELVDEEELLLVRNYLIGSILGDLDGPFHIMSRWKNIILNQLDEQYFYQSIQTIKTISAKELKDLANKYLNPEDFYELIVT